MIEKSLRIRNWGEVPAKYSGLVIFRSGDKTGDKHWLQNGRHHRENGPAVEWANGCKFWLRNNLRHRLDGPAIEWVEGVKEYFILDYKLTREEFELFQILYERTLLEKTDKLMKTFVKLARMT